MKQDKLKPMLPIALGAATIIGLIIMGSQAQASTVDEHVLNSIMPSRKRKGAHTPVVSFHEREVPFTLKQKNKKTGHIKNVQVSRLEVTDDISDLTAEASRKIGRPISVDVFVLATLSQSEAGDGPAMARVAIMHAALAKAKKDKKPLLQLLAPDGKLGGQLGRYAATGKPPTPVDIELAEAVLKGKVPNPTPGAVMWDSPDGMNKLAKQGAPGYRASEDEISPADKLAQVRKDRDHMVDIYPPGVDPEYLRMWKPDPEYLRVGKPATA
jgi:hypothetical protein